MNQFPTVQIAADEEVAHLNENKRQAQLRYWSLVVNNQLYQGDVSAKTKAKRRSANKRARQQRKINRLRSK